MIGMVVFCDRCNPGRQSARATQGRGVHEGDWVSATECDWELRDGKHVCSQCIEEEEQQARDAIRATENRKV